MNASNTNQGRMSFIDETGQFQQDQGENVDRHIETDLVNIGFGDQFQHCLQQQGQVGGLPSDLELMRLIKEFSNYESTNSNDRGNIHTQMLPESSASPVSIGNVNSVASDNNSYCAPITMNSGGATSSLMGNKIGNMASNNVQCRRVSDELSSNCSVSDMLDSTVNTNSFVTATSDARLNFSDLENFINNNKGSDMPASSMLSSNQFLNGSMNLNQSVFNGGINQFSDSSMSVLSQLYGNNNMSMGSKNNKGMPTCVSNSNFRINTDNSDSYTLENMMSNGNNSNFASFNNISNNSTGIQAPQASPLIGERPLVIPPKKHKNKVKQTFAQKLMHVLSVKENHDYIRWMPNGQSFCILNAKLLVEKVLPVYFKEAKYTSFTRKLNRWGFRHFNLPSDSADTKEISVYSHEKFLRDQPELCQVMDGGHRKRTSLKQEQQRQEQNVQQMQLGRLQQDQMQNLQKLQSFQNAQGSLYHGMQQQQQQQQQNQLLDLFALNMRGQGWGQGSGYGQGGGNGMSHVVSNTSNLFQHLNQTNNTSLNENMSNDSFPLMNSMINADNTVYQMRRTSLGFMPYLPTTTRRDSGFGSIGGGNELYPISGRVSGMGCIGMNESSVGLTNHSITPPNEINNIFL